MKKGMRTAVSVLLAFCFFGSSGFLLHQFVQYRHAEQDGQTVAELVRPEEPVILPEPEVPLAPLPEPEAPEQEPLAEEAEFLLELDLEPLKQTNAAVLGWIHIPDSPISYPLLEVEDNNQYLRRAWDGTPRSAGCIFLECENDPGFGDFNTMIYGHFMWNGTMFGSLHEYREQEYADSHPAVYIRTREQVLRYEVFAAYEADVVSNTYRLYFEDDARKQSVVEEYLAQTVIHTGLVPTAEDRILTLSTCTGTGTYDTRWVVQAVLTGAFPAREKAEP